MNESGPQLLKDPHGTTLGKALGCSANCEVIFGQEFSELEIGDERLNKPKAWFWTADGRFGVLEPRFSPGDYVHEPAAIDAAGTMIVGTAPSIATLADPTHRGVQAIAWTQRTGTTLLGGMTHLALNEVDWHAFNYESRAVDISNAGDRILVRHYREHAEEGPSVRAGILRLIPKE